MQAAKHTPGPWEISQDQPGIGEVPEIGISATNPRTGNVYMVATAIPCGSGRLDRDLMPEMTAANARLIAAAPDMLRALELIVNSDMAQREEDEGKISTELAHARAAIAKATGSEAT